MSLDAIKALRDNPELLQAMLSGGGPGLGGLDGEKPSMAKHFYDEYKHEIDAGAEILAEVFDKLNKSGLNDSFVDARVNSRKREFEGYLAAGFSRSEALAFLLTETKSTFIEQVIEESKKQNLTSSSSSK